MSSLSSKTKKNGSTTGDGKTRALIGVYFNEDIIVTERYEGDQTAEELDQILPTYQGQAIVKNMIGLGTISRLPKAHDGSPQLAKDKTVRKHPKVIMQTIEDYARLKEESVRAVKLDRLKANEEAQKDAEHKKWYAVAFEEDDWRPDEIYVVQRGQGDWAGRLVWRKLVDGEWIDINPEVIYVNEHPEEANEIFDRIKGKTQSSKRSTRKGTKRKTAAATTSAPAKSKKTAKTDDYEPLMEENVVEVKELTDEDAKYAKMLDDLGNNQTSGYEFEE